MFRVCLLAALVLAAPALAQNAGLDHRFGQNGLVSVRDPAFSNARNLGLAACAGPNRTLNVIAATAIDKLTLFRIRPDGALDTTFSGDGIENVTVPSSGEDTAQGACMADGRIVIVRMGPGSTANDKNIQLLRVTADGQLDASFGTGGVLVVDFDAHVPALGDLEFPLGLNLTSGDEILISTRIYLADNNSRPGIVRVSAAGQLMYARLIDVPGMTAFYASAAGIGPDGRIWVLGGGNPTGVPISTWFRSELDPANGNTLQTFIGTEGNYVVDGGRVLASGIMVAVGKFVPQSEPGGAYRPRLLVFRESGASHVVLPTPFAVNTSVPTLAPFPGHGVAIPIADGRVLFTAPLGSQNQEYELATYGAVVQLGASAAEDQVDIEFGSNGATQFAYRTAEPCANGSPTLQRPVRFSNWLGRPVMAGIHATTCTVNPRNTLVARLLTSGDVFSDGMED